MDPTIIAIFTALGGLVCLMSLRFVPTKIPLKEGEAIIRSRAAAAVPGEKIQVSFTTEYVLGAVDTWEKIDISPKTCIYEVSGQLEDGSDVSLEVRFVVCIPKKPQQVLLAAETLGVERASSQEAIQDFFHYPILETVQTALAKVTTEILLNESERVNRFLFEIGSWTLEERGFELHSIEIQKVRCHKGGQSWIR